MSWPPLPLPQWFFARLQWFVIFSIFARKIMFWWLFCWQQGRLFSGCCQLQPTANRRCFWHFHQSTCPTIFSNVIFFWRYFLFFTFQCHQQITHFFPINCAAVFFNSPLGHLMESMQFAMVMASRAVIFHCPRLVFYPYSGFFNPLPILFFWTTTTCANDFFHNNINIQLFKN